MIPNSPPYNELHVNAEWNTALASSTGFMLMYCNTHNTIPEKGLVTNIYYNLLYLEVEAKT